MATPVSSAPSNSPESPVRTYFGWQHERVAFLFGLSGQRALMIGAGVLVGIWPVSASNMRMAVVCWPIAAVLFAAAFIRINGRTADEWVTAAVSFQALRFRNQHKFLSAAFAPDNADPSRGKPLDLPGILAPVSILDAYFPGGAPLALAKHRIDRTYTAIARVTFPGIGLVDSSRREQRVSGWGGLLAGLCTEGSPIVRVQALQRLVPESGAALRRWHGDHLAVDAPEAAVAVTESLLATATLATSQREAFLAFTMDERRAASTIKAAGGGSVGAATVMTRHLRALAAQIGGADLHIQAWLGPRDLAEVIRTAYDPHSARHLADRRAGANNTDGEGLAAGVAASVTGPAAAEATPGHYLHDGAVSATYWVAEWPRSQTHATVLAPLLGEGLHRRAFSMHFEPLGPREAEKSVMRERTKRSVAVRMRQRTGQIVPEHEQAALERAAAQDAERAAGHGLVRMTGYVTVTVTDPGELDDACAAVEADAAAARIEVRRMWFAQDIGFAMSALPLGFGLPKKRW
ncbi:PrgI family protein [Phytomonospora endophytica]|uniref:PrgI family protein n=1 Tax=Phytomonospora endophytica TaxID=714109 RepID=A0A841FVD1_9ACTN|nr:PrgI family protein [Phytomonospora endophytica]MBB6037688.1 hypothetical protein [Phytomonospora endophytica]GIG67785.1 hypothetical protein Pen01_40800 [Phytomonospora endophytica]